MLEPQKYEPQFQDEDVVCCDCGQVFTFSKGEARFYWSKQLTFPPRRCPACRAARRRTLVPDPNSIQGVGNG